MQNKKIVVLDHGNSDLMENKIFNPDLAKKVSHTILPTCYLYQEAQKQGIQFVTSDIFLGLKEKPKNTLLMSHLKTAYTEKLIFQGAKPIILTCQESPVIATHFYINLKKISSLYKHSFVFEGMKKRLSKKTIYHQTFFVQPYNFEDFKFLEFKNKKFLTMISSAKDLKNYKKIIKTLILKLMYSKEIKEIYSERIKAIKFFSQKTNFDLFGFGWGKKKFDKFTNLAIKKTYRETISDKLETLRNYKFALCFENAVFEGYITEKIFDAMFAGCVPIYYGAPDIKKYIPENAFIGLREFKNYEELNDYLHSINEEQYQEYLKNIQKFLSSEQYYKFSQEYFAKEILNILNQEFFRI